MASCVFSKNVKKMTKNIYLSLVITIQLLYIMALVVFFSAIIKAGILMSAGDPALVSGLLSEGIISSCVGALIALVGLVFSCVIISHVRELPVWFLVLTKCLSFFWLLFFPVGTVLAIFQLRKMRSVIAEHI